MIYTGKRTYDIIIICDSVTYYISTILKFALGSKISYTNKYLPSKSENDHSDIFNSKTM